MKDDVAFGDEVPWNDCYLDTVLFDYDEDSFIGVFEDGLKIIVHRTDVPTACTVAEFIYEVRDGLQI